MGKSSGEASWRVPDRLWKSGMVARYNLVGRSPIGKRSGKVILLDKTV
jgi:hypothetical protein